MNASRIATGVLVILGLAGGGAAAAALLFRARPERPAPQAESVSTNLVVTPGAVDTSDIEFRLRRLEAQSATSAAPGAATGVTAAAADSAGPASEESSRRWIEEKSAREAQVAAEPDDPKWSRQATASFRKEFEAIGVRNKFKVVDVECKTTSCLAKLSWNSYSDARRTWRRVLLGDYTRNCARKVFVPVPEQGQDDSAYEGTVFLDCTEDRAQ